MGTAAKRDKVQCHAGASAGLRWRWAISGLLMGTLLLPPLTACQRTDPRPGLPTVTAPPSSVADTSRKYAPVLDEVRKALENEFPGIGWRAGDPYSIGERTDGQCSLRLPTLRSEGDIVGASDQFQKVMNAINPVLEPNGFSAVSVLDEGSQGWWSVTSGNNQGARVSIFGRTWVELTFNVPVESESCAAGELTGLAP
jgi:hypothetical protein